MFGRTLAGRHIAALSKQNLATPAAYNTCRFFTEIKVQRRTDPLNRRTNAKLKKEGLVPGIIYGKPRADKTSGSLSGAEKIPIQIGMGDVKRAQRVHGISLENVVFKVEVEGEGTVEVTPRQLQLHVVTREPQNLNFLRYEPDRPLNIPVVFTGEDASPGLKRGGYINQITTTLKCACPEGKVPNILKADVSGLYVGESVQLDRVAFPEGVEIYKKKRHPGDRSPMPRKIVVGSISGTRAQQREGRLARLGIAKADMVIEEDEWEEL